MIYTGKDRKDSLDEMRRATLLKQAAAPALMMNNPGQQLNTKQYIGNNDQETGRSILQGGTNSLPFQNLGHVNNANTAPGSHVNSLAKIFRPATGTAVNVASVANKQSKMAPPQVAGLQQQKLASVALGIDMEDLVKVARVRSALTGVARKGLDATSRTLGKFRDWVRSKKPTIELSKYREPKLQLEYPPKPSGIEGHVSGATVIPGTSGARKPLGFWATTRNILSPKGFKQWAVGAGPKDKYTLGGRSAVSRVGDDAAEAAPFGTYRQVDKSNPLDIAYGTKGQPAGVGFNDLSIWQRMRAARAANRSPANQGRRYSVAPWRAGRDITKGNPGDILAWGQRTKRLPGIRRVIPTADSFVGKTGKTFLGMGALGYGTTYYNPLYDVGMSAAPGDVQITDVKEDPTKPKLTQYQRLKKAVGVGGDWASWRTLPSLAASIGTNIYEDKPMLGPGIINRILGTDKNVDEVNQVTPGHLIYDKEGGPGDMRGLMQYYAEDLGEEQAAQRAARAEIARIRRQEMEKRIKEQESRSDTQGRNKATSAKNTKLPEEARVSNR